MAAQAVAIAWKHDLDGGLAEAQLPQRNALLDFSAAPM
jgi:hypothetical protein